MLKADQFPCLKKDIVSKVFNLDAANLNQTADLAKFQFINTTIETSEIDNQENLSYKDLFDVISSLNSDYFSYNGNCSFLYIHSPPGTGKTLLCKKLASELIRQKSQDVHIRMISTTELTSDPKLNLLIEIAYSSNIMGEIIDVIEASLVKDLRNNYNDYNKINLWITTIIKFLKEFEKSRKDPSYIINLKEKYDQIIEVYKEFQTQTENFLEYQIKTMLGQRQLDISKNITDGIINNEIEYARSNDFRYIMITLDDAVIGTGEQSEFNQKILSTLTTLAQKPIPEGLEGFLFIYGITFPPPTTLRDRSRQIKLNYRWIEINDLVLNYLKSKLSSIVDEQIVCEDCPHLASKNCSKNLSSSFLNENFLNKWINLEFTESTPRENKTPRTLSKKFGTMLINYINSNNLLQTLRKNYTKKDLVELQLGLENEEEILNFLNLMFWFGEKAENGEYGIPESDVWIIKDAENELDEYFKKNLIYFKEGYLFTSLKTPAINFEIGDKTSKNQDLEIIPVMREDIKDMENKVILLSYKHKNNNFIDVQSDNDQYTISLPDIGEYLLRLSIKFKYKNQPIQFKKEKVINVEDFPCIIESPKNSEKFLPKELKSINIKRLDPLMKPFTLNCEKPDGKKQKKAYSFISDESILEISWIDFLDNDEPKGKYKIFLSHTDKVGSPTEIVIMDSPVIVDWSKDIDTRTISFTITLQDDVELESYKFSDNFKVEIVPKGEDKRENKK